MPLQMGIFYRNESSNSELMVLQISYQFTNAPEANRFLNELKHWSLHEVRAKLYKRSDSVTVHYEFDGKGFDYTCSDLDDLARIYNGIEI